MTTELSIDIHSETRTTSPRRSGFLAAKKATAGLPGSPKRVTAMPGQTSAMARRPRPSGSRTRASNKPAASPRTAIPTLPRRIEARSPRHKPAPACQSQPRHRPCRPLANVAARRSSRLRDVTLVRSARTKRNR